jgi:hypothetical protein
MTHRLFFTAFVVVATITFLARPLAIAGQGAKTDITGKWAFEVQTSAGGGTPTVTFKQEGEKVTGHYSSTNLGEADLTGTVKGREIAFMFTAAVQGNSVEVGYSGTIESNDSMKGKVDIGGLAQGTFTAKRQ